MKLLKMKRIEDIHNKYGIDPNGECDWFIHLETEEEYTRYLMFVDTDNITMNGYTKRYLDGKRYGFWSGYMSTKLGDYYEDDDIFHYLTVDDNVPAVGETYELDGIKYERIE